jgi:hypothetical protein
MKIHLQLALNYVSIGIYHYWFASDCMEKWCFAENLSGLQGSETLLELPWLNTSAYEDLSKNGMPVL